MAAILSATGYDVDAQIGGASPSNRSEITNKALITKSGSEGVLGAAAVRKMAADYYGWRNENYPVRSSDAGLHTWDNKLTDYSPAKISARAQHVRSLLEKVRAIKIDNPDTIGARGGFLRWAKGVELT